MQLLFLLKLPLYLSVVWTHLCDLTITICYCDLAFYSRCELSFRGMFSNAILRKSEFASERDECHGNAGTPSCVQKIIKVHHNGTHSSTLWNVQYSTAAHLPVSKSTQKRRNKHQQCLTFGSGSSDVSISSVSVT